MIDIIQENLNYKKVNSHLFKLLQEKEEQTFAIIDKRGKEINIESNQIQVKGGIKVQYRTLVRTIKQLNKFKAYDLAYDLTKVIKRNLGCKQLQKHVYLPMTGKEFRRLRLATSLTIAKFAELAGVPASSIYKYEARDSYRIRVETWKKYNRIFEQYGSTCNN